MQSQTKASLTKRQQPISLKVVLLDLIILLFRVPIISYFLPFDPESLRTSQKSFRNVFINKTSFFVVKFNLKCSIMSDSKNVTCLEVFHRRSVSQLTKMK